MDNENEVAVKSGSGKKIIIAVVVLIIILVGGYFVFKHSGAGSASAQSVATVNGVALPKTTFDTQLASAIASYAAQGVSATSTPEELAQIKQQVLDNMIDNELLNQGVKAAGITASSTEVEAQYQALVSQAGGADKLATELTQSKMTDAQLRQNISNQLAVQAYLLQNIDVSTITASDAEVAAFYAQYSAQQKAAGQTVPALTDLSAQIKQQIISNKENTAVTNFIAGLRAKATIATSTAL
jgi:hypothetical protein